jgi:hypothetical protein
VNLKQQKSAGQQSAVYTSVLKNPVGNSDLSQVLNKIPGTQMSSKDGKIRLTRSERACSLVAEIAAANGLLAIGSQATSTRDGRLSVASRMLVVLVWGLLVSVLLNGSGLRKSVSAEWARRHASGGDLGLVQALNEVGGMDRKPESASLAAMLVDDPLILSGMFCLVVGFLAGISMFLVKANLWAVVLFAEIFLGVPSKEDLDQRAIQFRDQIVRNLAHGNDGINQPITQIFKRQRIDDCKK